MLLCWGYPLSPSLRPFIKLTSSRAMLFHVQLREGGTERKQNQNSGKRGILRANLTKNLLTHAHRILPRVILFAEIWLYKSYASSSSKPHRWSTVVFTRADAYGSRLKKQYCVAFSMNRRLANPWGRDRTSFSLVRCLMLHLSINTRGRWF